MNRKQFIQKMAAIPMATLFMDLKSLNTFAHAESVMPALFLGHGSPMNAIEENEFVAGFRQVAQTLPQPKAILCISAHWETPGTFVTSNEWPKTIHDFGGFPKALFDVQYPAPGSPNLAMEAQKAVTKTKVELSDKWGLDHGAWSVIKHLYPKANIPVVQMSIDYRKPPAYHYELAKELGQLRKKGILIIGSGNMVHNLGMVAWDKLNADNYGYDWALEASEKMKGFILSDNHKALIDFGLQGKSFQLAIPTPEHYIPLLYTLGLKEKNEKVGLFNDKAVGGSLTMTSVKLG